MTENPHEETVLAKGRLQEQMVKTLMLQKWTHSEIRAYLDAQKTHGGLRPGIPLWLLKSYLYRWPRMAPSGDPGSAPNLADQ